MTTIQALCPCPCTAAAPQDGWGRDWLRETFPKKAMFCMFTIYQQDLRSAACTSWCWGCEHLPAASSTPPSDKSQALGLPEVHCGQSGQCLLSRPEVTHSGGWGRKDASSTWATKESPRPIELKIKTWSLNNNNKNTGKRKKARLCFTCNIYLKCNL